jgi:hypothetical protein
MSVNVYVIEDYENETASRPKKTNPNKANFRKAKMNLKLPKNLASPARQFHNRIGQYYKIRVKHYFLAGLWMQAD